LLKNPYSTNRPNPIFSSDTLSTYTSTKHKIHQINLPHVQQDNSFSRHVSSFFTVLSNFPRFQKVKSSQTCRATGRHHGTMSTSWHGALVTVGRIPGSPGSALTSIGEVGELEEESGFSVRGIQYEKQKSTENPQGSQEFFHIFHEI
jgi:hypothetical protein